jgi:hypothetical protein
VGQKEDVLDVVVGLVATRGLLARLPRVDPFEDAEAAGSEFGGGGGREKEGRKK